MNTFSTMVKVYLIIIYLFEVLATEDLGRGLGEDYDWHSLNEGLEISRETGKPLMLVIHKSWCSACKAFKPKFRKSKTILELSKNFVMVNVQDKEEPKDPKYAPDGGYIPRILFLDSNGVVHTEIQHEGGNPSYKFFYSDEDEVVRSMRSALEKIGPNSVQGDEL